MYLSSELIWYLICSDVISHLISSYLPSDKSSELILFSHLSWSWSLIWADLSSDLPSDLSSVLMCPIVWCDLMWSDVICSACSMMAQHAWCGWQQSWIQYSVFNNIWVYCEIVNITLSVLILLFTAWLHFNNSSKLYMAIHDIDSWLSLDCNQIMQLFIF